MTGNGNHITYKNGDLGDGLWHCFNHMIRIECVLGCIFEGRPFGTQVLWSSSQPSYNCVDPLRRLIIFQQDRDSIWSNMACWTIPTFSRISQLAIMLIFQHWSVQRLGRQKKAPAISPKKSFLGGAKVKKLLCCKLHNSHCEIIDTLPAMPVTQDGSTMADLSHPNVSSRQQRPLKIPVSWSWRGYEAPKISTSFLKLGPRERKTARSITVNFWEPWSPHELQCPLARWLDVVSLRSSGFMRTNLQNFTVKWASFLLYERMILLGEQKGIPHFQKILC